MKSVVNAFSILSLDGEDDKEHTVSPPAGSNSAESDKDMIKVKESGKLPQLRNEKESGTSVATSSEEYRLPLVWIDLKMTGLDVEVDRILEIACVITDGKLTKMLEGPDLVIRQPMGEWSCDHNAASERVLQSTISEQDAEKKIMEFVKQHVGAYSIHLAGNSVYVDFLFLKKYMPELAGLFSHILIDVSSVRALCFLWFPQESEKVPSKEHKHRAMDDIKESINELKYLKENFFKRSK